MRHSYQIEAGAVGIFWVPSAGVHFCCFVDNSLITMDDDARGGYRNAIIHVDFSMADKESVVGLKLPDAKKLALAVLDEDDVAAPVLADEVICRRLEGDGFVPRAELLERLRFLEKARADVLALTEAQPGAEFFQTYLLKELLGAK